MSVFAAITPVVDIASAQEGVVFAMGGDDDVFGRRRAHRFAHHFPALDPAAVVGEGHAMAFHQVEIDQFLSEAPEGDGAVGEHPDEGVPVDCFLLHGQMRKGVRHGIQVGHRAHEGIPAPGGGPAAAADGFFPSLSRLTEMYVKVGESG